ncbi:glycosyl transferase [Loigolactobacillus coryniformis subsp. coryniformis]|nr:glycosyltransferase family 2 protein [Loigolactobacillus coryniformis]ATO54229.1 glycosyl transferase [Loigolactobacillus coryniformis subsp. coryniformis KCTC 3167 = DSM 20001]OEH89935.1 glycosyl transferase [Loigolactobacillus coryniformis subsp. coryniformis]
MATMSLVIPCYNNEKMIPLFYAAAAEVVNTIQQTWENIDVEYWFIDDGSCDRTLDQLQQLQARAKFVHYISFSRNFGQEAAIYAGLQQATGKYVALMAGDPQILPNLLPQMLSAIIEEHYDIVVGTRQAARTEVPNLRAWFIKKINHFTKVKVNAPVGDCRLMTRQVLDAVMSLPEYNRFSLGIFNWVGFTTKYLAYQNDEDGDGQPTRGFWQVISDSVNGISGFLSGPLALVFYVGLTSFIAALIVLVVIVMRLLVLNDPANGWLALISIILLLGGIQLLCLGIVSKYIAEIYLETKHWPIYIAKEIK